MDSEKSTSANRRISIDLPGPACHVLAVLVGLLAAMLLIACATSGAEAAPLRATYPAHRRCASPAPGRGQCVGIRLLS